jgi:hypothetical protein
MGLVKLPGLPLRRAASQHYVENGDFGGTLDVLTFSSRFAAFFAAFFAFLTVFRSSLDFFDILISPPTS